MLKALVIGAGHIGRQHAACLRQVPGARLEGICDLSAATAAMVAERYGVPCHFDDYEEAIERVEPDVIHVATPLAAHVPLATRALETGAHVIVEKPLAPDPDGLTALLAAAERAAGDLVEDYTYVFDPRVERARELLGSGDLGQFLHAHITLSLDLGGAAGAVGAASRSGATPGVTEVGDFLPHLCSLAEAFVGTPRGMRAVWERDAGVVSGVRALVEGERGTATIVFSGRGRPDACSLRVDATGGQIAVGLFEPDFVVRRPRSGPRPLTPLVNAGVGAFGELLGAGRGLVRKLSGDSGSYEGLWRLIELSYGAWNKGGPPPVSASTIATVNRLMFSILDEAP